LRNLPIFSYFCKAMGDCMFSPPPYPSLTRHSWPWRVFVLSAARNRAAGNPAFFAA
jgi:hypothetical protein